MLVAKNNREPYDQAALAARVKSAVAEAVKKQLDCGLDIINDGELGKPNFSRYARERLAGFVERPARTDERPSTIYGRDLKEFAEYFEKGRHDARREHLARLLQRPAARHRRRGAGGHRQFQGGIEGLKVEEAFPP
jgi:5-methyltetrahydropteroyltriglutamate--homocysteine methyltransferase